MIKNLLNRSLQAFALYNGSTTQLSFIDGASVVWPGGGQPPPDVPVCGYRNENPACMPPLPGTVDNNKLYDNIARVTVLLLQASQLDCPYSEHC